MTINNLCTLIDDLYYVFAKSTFIITGSITLKELNISYNNIGNKGISVITDGLQYSKKLAKLEILTCNFTAKGSYS